MIKLYKIDELDNGKTGFGFYKYHRPYKIVENISEMRMQPL